ncbi:transposase [Metallosphaera yellowstonensis MK1]|uniref:Transposase n=1 Tax=Metallosphaera yellowstonensis MK1 TaxID=671065 RepID=H2C0Z2_9CREN|nr:transposase [Metallosphaera yellowstonensis MK1]
MSRYYTARIIFHNTILGLPRGRRVVYGLEWVTVRLPVMYRGGERVRTRVEEELLREERLVLRALLLLYSVLGGKLNAKLWTQELEVRGDFKYVVVDGKYVKLRGGRRGVLLLGLGLTDHGVRAVLDVVLTGEEDVVSYWDLPVRLWRRYNLTLVVADGVKALDTAISRSGIKVARQTCLVHLKRSRRVRVLLDLLLSLAESVPTRGSPLLSYLLAPRELWSLLRSNNLAESFNSLLERRRFGKCHSPWRILQIARAIALNYNLSTCYLIIVIILQDPLFLRKMVKYIQ